MPTIRYRQYVLSHHQSAGSECTPIPVHKGTHSIQFSGGGWAGSAISLSVPTAGLWALHPTLERRQLQGWCLSQPTWHHEAPCLRAPRALNLVRAIYGISKGFQKKTSLPVPHPKHQIYIIQIKLGQRRAKDYKMKKLSQRVKNKIVILANTSTVL